MYLKSHFLSPSCATRDHRQRINDITNKWRVALGDPLLSFLEYYPKGIIRLFTHLTACGGSDDTLVSHTEQNQTTHLTRKNNCFLRCLN